MPDDLTKTQEELIVSQIIAGQKDLFRILVRQYERAVYGMGLSFFRNTEDAADFTQDVFLKAYQNLYGFEGRSRFSTWLYKIAYNTAISEINSRREYRSLSEDDINKLASNIDTPEGAAVKEAVKDAIQKTVKDLPERFRICIDLFFFYDCTYQEIEHITAIPVNTVKSHVLRAKALLKEKLDNIL